MKRYYYKDPPRPRKKIVLKVCGVISILTGVAMLFYFFFPLLSYQVFVAGAYAQDTIETPVPKYMSGQGSSGLSALFTQGISALTTDYNDARNWYPTVKSNVNSQKQVDSYTLAIPRLHIPHATVSTTNYDLGKNLVQYYGTSTPPENGTAVILGHSTLPQWFDPNNYHAVFATLHTIQLGDDIFLTVEGQQYHYKVDLITITSPDDTSIFSQQYDTSHLAIVTCTPPGTTWKRLVVRASIVR